jgi:predicted Zn-dependent protease
LIPFTFVSRETALLKIDYTSEMQSRIEIFQQMLEAEPDNTMVMFGLAKEYEKLGEWKEMVETLELYLSKADDEGNAYGTLAMAYAQRGDREKAIETLKKGIDVSAAHGHPSMANEYKMTLDLDYGE